MKNKIHTVFFKAQFSERSDVRLVQVGDDPVEVPEGLVVPKGDAVAGVVVDDGVAARSAAGMPSR